MAAETWTVLIEWEDSPVADATEMVVQAISERQAVEIARSEWEAQVRGVFPTCKFVNALPLQKGSRWLVVPATWE